MSSLRLFLLPLSLFWTLCAQAQFYAPETRFHDTAQRRYVVELARVLASREPGVAEIAYTLTSERDGAAKWAVRWLDAEEKTVRDCVVQYPAALLVEGPRFYREVYRQLAAGMKVPPLGPALSAAQVAETYWQGAEQMGYSRAAGLRAAFALVAQPGTANVSAQLAGLFAHTALSSLSEPMALDAVLLARSAAWLAVSEAQVAERDRAEPVLDPLWTPLLYLAGRENAACALWQKGQPTKPNAVATCWDYLATQPKMRDAFVFVAAPENRRFLMPVMSYHCRRLGMEFDFGSLLPAIFEDEEEMTRLLYDHAPSVIRRQKTNMFSDAAVVGRLDWIDCLRKFTPGPLDYVGYLAELKRQRVTLKDLAEEGDTNKRLEDDDESDESVQGLKGAAPLLSLGEKEGLGKLIPVTTVTARDLLNYGYEMTGVQIAARFILFKGKDVSPYAKKMAETVIPEVRGLDLFFVADSKNAAPVTLATFDRFQDVQYLFATLEGNRDFWRENVAKFEDFTSRYWLQGEMARASCSALYHANKTPRIVPYLQRVRAEGGPLVDGHLRQWLALDLRDDGRARVPGAEAYEVKWALEQKEREMDKLTLNMLWTEHEKRTPLERAQELEAFYWSDASPDAYISIFDDYVGAHAYTAARRFLQQLIPRIDEETYANNFAQRRFMLAWLTNDQQAVLEAVQADKSRSFAEIYVNIMAAAAADSFDTMEKLTDELIARYGKVPMAMTLKAFLPFLPALREPAHPSHGKALDFFAKNDAFIQLQWILMERAKLTPEEGIRFFGGSNTDWVRQFVVLYLQGDKEGFAKKFDDHERNWRKTHQEWKATTLVHHLRNELLAIPVPAEQPDLKPRQALSLLDLVLASLGTK